MSNILEKVIKTIFYNLSEIFYFIFSNCIEHGVYPDKIKQTMVIHIFKSGKKTDIENYRPFSTLFIINPIFEKMIYERVNSFVNLHNLVSRNQYGFKNDDGVFGPVIFV